MGDDNNAPPADLEEFLGRVNEVHNVVLGMKEGDTTAYDRAGQLINKLSQDSDGADGVRVRADRTCINSTTNDNSSSGSTPTTTAGDSAVGGVNAGPAMSQNAFMQQMAQDAEERAKRRRHNREASEEHRLKGNEHFKRGEHDSAVDAYTTALRLYPDSLVLYTNRAQAHLKLQQYSEALDDCEWALRLHDRHPKALLRKGLALRGLLRFEDALASLTAAMKALTGSKRQAVAKYVQETEEMKEQHEREAQACRGLPANLKKEHPTVYDACQRLVNALADVDKGKAEERAGGSSAGGAGEDKTAGAEATSQALPPVTPTTISSVLHECTEDEALAALPTTTVQQLQHEAERAAKCLQALAAAAARVVDDCHRHNVDITSTAVTDIVRLQGGAGVLERSSCVDLLARISRMAAAEKAHMCMTHMALVESLVGAAAAALHFLATMCSACKHFATAAGARGDTMRRVKLLAELMLPALQLDALALLKTIASNAAKPDQVVGHSVVACLSHLITSGRTTQDDTGSQSTAPEVAVAAAEALAAVMRVDICRQELMRGGAAVISHIVTSVQAQQSLLALARACAHVLLQASCHARLRPLLFTHIRAITAAVATQQQCKHTSAVAGLLATLSNMGLDASGFEQLTATTDVVLLCVKCLGDTDVRAHTTTTANAVALLARMCSSSQLVAALVRSGGIQTLVDLLTADDEATVGHAVRCLAKSLSTDVRADVAAAMTDTRALEEQIIPLLSSSSDAVVGNAALCLAGLFLDEKVAAAAPVACVDALLHVAKREKGPIQQNGAMALARACKDEAKLLRLRQLNGFEVLFARAK
ncbi:hypothetical protein PTSG_08291 [Salpingoeca rosetta]|uniref:Uncharacterized protein n=1 Tax=Salpingoeca rosetta (strain ATCC 50818 / BSB-021) TaxID=946362 RepID=F2UJA0_SALR5|nr:uncharacterized protein PTSG_08291 [Salpingoeca rosetta]EGD77199.1 hypothetical protein PTSG_08291 [Salpingoeca rosetta]|eukprot:XP_004990543.1 hypothetical protein PTSG_08291 [Salpingoeca rosetta]